MHQVYLGIGGNLGCRLSNLCMTVNLLKRYAGVIIKASPIYMTEAWGFTHNRSFLNAVLLIETKLNPDDLLLTCYVIETKLKRIRTDSVKYEGRNADIDILFFNDSVIHNEKLQIPHPFAHERNFVLYPMSDISPNFIHPFLNTSILELKNKCIDNSKIRKLDFL
jgi:2-amino-4-hydroxy-6-hydroxymethyldihydropteridine diphosphokinase